METAEAPQSNATGNNKIDLEAAGIEPDRGQEPNRLTLRDFGRIGLQNGRLTTPSHSPPVPPSPLESPPVVEVFWRRQGRFPRPRVRCCCLLIGEDGELGSIANRSGFRYFTDSEGLKEYVRGEILAEVGVQGG